MTRVHAWSIGGGIFAMGLLILGSVTAQEPPAPAAGYGWKKGPIEAKLGDQAVLSLPEGYGFMGPEDTQRALKEMGNFPSGNELGLVAPAGEKGNWFVVIRFIDAGYVKDDDADNWNADEMLASIREGTEEMNARRKELGFEPIVLKGWEEKPRYDRKHNKVVWAISAEEQADAVVNYNTLALGRHGYLSMNMVGGLKDLGELKPHVQVLLNNLNFVPGKTYADFDSTTDKVAAAGLTALIAGAAIKSGLLAKLWAFIVPLVLAAKKLIVLLVIAIGGLLARFWRKRPAHTPPPGGAIQ
jgi:uncharacterized membrane-anchored protein